MKTIANNSVYYFLPWILFQCFETREEIERFLKMAVAAAVPVALYGIWQFFFGLRDFEVAYIRSGYAFNMAFTIDDVRPRPFSTLSSPHAYSLMMSIMVVLAFYFAFRQQGFAKKWFCAFLVLFAALATSMVRTAILTGVAAIVFSMLFTSRRGTRAAYLLCGAFLAAIIANAESLLDGLEFWQKYLPSETAWQEMAFRLGTTSNRLMGFKNVLSNPSAWPLVANPLNYQQELLDTSSALHTHDLYSQMILKYGIIPVAFGAIVAIYCAIKIHAAVFRLPAGEVRNLGAGMVAITAGFFLSNVSGGGIGLFPLNFWIGVIVGCLIILCFRIRPSPRQESIVPVQESHFSQSPATGRKLWQQPARLAPKH